MENTPYFNEEGIQIVIPLLHPLIWLVMTPWPILEEHKRADCKSSTKTRREREAPRLLFPLFRKSLFYGKRLYDSLLFYPLPPLIRESPLPDRQRAWPPLLAPCQPLPLPALHKNLVNCSFVRRFAMKTMGGRESGGERAGWERELDKEGRIIRLR